MAQGDSGNIRIGVGLMPIVSCAKTASVGQELPLQLIEGLKWNELVWRCGGKPDVLTRENLTVVFDEPGLYIPVAQGHLLHVSYGVNVVIQAPYDMRGLDSF